MDTGALTISYARVKAILDDAAGASTADYGGAGRFWDNGAEALETADIYGVKMIAEAPAHACCAVDGARSKASGLIKGLRGEAPFDGGRFPRLPWGGSAVTPFDIDCIADWIDAGCPGETTSVAVPLSPGDAAAPATIRGSSNRRGAVWSPRFCEAWRTAAVPRSVSTRQRPRRCRSAPACRRARRSRWPSRSPRVRSRVRAQNQGSSPRSRKPRSTRQPACRAE